MRLKPIAKPVRIRIKSGGMEHSSVESLKSHFVVDDLKPLIHDGRLSRWLEQQNQEAIPGVLKMLDMESHEFEVALYKFFFDKDGLMSKADLYFLVYQETQKIVYLAYAASEGHKEAEKILKERKNKNSPQKKRTVTTDAVKNKFSVGPNVSQVAKEFNIGINTINEYLAKNGNPLHNLSPFIQLSSSQYDLIAKAFCKEEVSNSYREIPPPQESKQKLMNEVYEGRLLVGKGKSVNVVYVGSSLVPDQILEKLLKKYDNARLLKKRELEYIIKNHQIFSNRNGWSVILENQDSNQFIRISKNKIWGEGVHSRHVYECYLSSDIKLRKVRELSSNVGIMLLVRDIE